jgi:ParB family chromosome partitioning protein
MQIAIVENVQRKNLNPIEEARAFENMKERLGISPQELSKMLGLPNFYVLQKLKLVQLPEFVQNFVEQGELAEGAAIVLLNLDSNEAIIAAAKMAVRQKMTRSSVEKLVEKILLGKGIQPKTEEYYYRTKYQYMMDSFKDNLGWKMKIKSVANGKGKIEIEFLDEQELKDIYDKLEKVI